MPNAVKALSHWMQLILRVFSKGRAIVRARKCRMAVGRPPVLSEYRHERRFNRRLPSPHHIRTTFRFSGLWIEAVCLVRVRSLAWRLHMAAMKPEGREE